MLCNIAFSLQLNTSLYLDLDMTDWTIEDVLLFLDRVGLTELREKFIG